MATLLRTLVEASDAVAATRSRNAKRDALAAVVAAADDDELPLVLAFLAGAPRQDRLGVGWAALRDLDVAAAADPSLTVADVDAILQDLADASGRGVQAFRAGRLTDLFGAATTAEQAWLRALLHRELRQGAQDSALQAAIAVAADVPLDAVRRGVMLSDDAGRVALDARRGGVDALAAYRLRVGHPVQPMLAQTAASVTEAVAALGTARVEHKLDGARIQVHKQGADVRVWTRNLREATARVPEVVALVAGLPATSLVLDGEALALDRDGRPLPFQTTMARFSTRDDPEAAAAELPLTAVFFDLLHHDGDDLLDAPLHARMARLADAVPSAHVAAALATDDADAAEDFAAAALRAGQEGVVVKDLDAPYAAGRRGAAWRKVKPVHTLDLVVLAVERGSGRRSGWLSNLHLGARADDGEGFVMLGKTFKGLTDEMLTWQTARLGELAVGEADGYVVRVRPELVVEIALDGVQASSRYPGGVALRFARVVAHRPDKDPADADRLATVRAMLDPSLR